MGALLGCGQRAGAEAAPDAVATAGDEAVAEVAERARDEAQQAGDEWPRARQLGERNSDGGGAGEELLGRGGDGAKDEDGAGAGVGWGVRRGWRKAVAGEQGGDGGRTGGREAEAVVAVAGEEPLNGVIAEAAAAVVDDEQAGAERGGEVQGVRPVDWMIRRGTRERNCPKREDFILEPR